VQEQIKEQDFSKMHDIVLAPLEKIQTEANEHLKSISEYLKTSSDKEITAKRDEALKKQE
jgi:hypothetical protein